MLQHFQLDSTGARGTVGRVCPISVTWRLRNSCEHLANCYCEGGYGWWRADSDAADSQSSYFHNDVTWGYLAALKLSDGKLKFWKLGQVANIVLVIPHSNVSEERVFSVVAEVQPQSAATHQSSSETTPAVSPDTVENSRQFVKFGSTWNWGTAMPRRWRTVFKLRNRWTWNPATVGSHTSVKFWNCSIWSPDTVNNSRQFVSCWKEFNVRTDNWQESLADAKVSARQQCVYEGS